MNEHGGMVTVRQSILLALIAAGVLSAGANVWLGEHRTIEISCVPVHRHAAYPSTNI